MCLLIFSYFLTKLLAFTLAKLYLLHTYYLQFLILLLDLFNMIYINTINVILIGTVLLG